jgi:probable 2-oxoglutarate dehydrogenase E1 component DHKTD1
MYQKIRNRQSVPKLYEETLLVRYHFSSQRSVFIQKGPPQAAGTLTPEAASSARAAYKTHLEEQLKEADSYKPPADMLQNQWKNLVWPYSKEAQKTPETGVNVEVLKSVGRTSVTVPADFVSNPWNAWTWE